MPLDRRSFLGTLGAALVAPMVLAAAPQLLPSSKGRRVVIVGGGWGGLSAARQLRELAPEMEVVLLEKNASFWSCPMSNKWLVNLADAKHLIHEYQPAASAYGYTFIQAEVSAIDRERRRIITSQGELNYDWLILAVGIRYDYASWFGNDRRAREQAQQQYPCAYMPGSEFAALKNKLDNFKGGDLLMTLPLLPYRCPPSPYERAGMIAWMIKSRSIKGKLTLIDPNANMLGFPRIFSELYADQIVYVPNAKIKSIDPFNKKVTTDLADFRFDDAILMPPQQAGELVWQAGLIGKDASGRPTGWADQHPLHLHAMGDERVFLIGDLIGKSSPLFNHYPKSGHMANRLGHIAARQIAARSQGKPVENWLPESACFVTTQLDPPEMTRVDASYRLRGDGLIMQTMKQTHDPNPRGEDLQWAQGMFREFLALKT